jgi:tetratricopeptide (TPR) repeat protein
MIHFSVNYSQNLFNESNTYKFADYLFKTRQYNLASEEYERLVQMVPSSLDYKLTLIQSYRLNKNYTFAEQRMIDFFNDSLYSLHSPIYSEYLKIKFYQLDLPNAQKYININPNIETTSKLKYQEFIYLLSRDWHKADSFFRASSGLDPRYGQLAQSGLSLHRKIPGLAAIMSTIIPGTGKVYSGYWKDGIMSFIFVAANSWQTYRRYDKYGINNAGVWIFGSLATGFYLGNIYGSIKAAKKYNKTKNDEIYNRAKGIIFSDIQ